MPQNMKLAKKGQGEPLVGVRDQAGYSLGLSSKHAQALEGGGWRAGTEHAALVAVAARLDAQRGEQAEARDQSRLRSRAEQRAVSEAKAFKRHLDLAVSDLFGRATYDATLNLPVTREALQTKGLGVLGRSTAKISSWLGDVRPHVQALEPQLSPYFGGTSPVAKLEAVKGALDSAQAVQEVGLASLPAETLDVYEAKGEAVLLIERLNRAGKMAFAGDAVVAAQFNKDILLRARRSRDANAIDAPAA